MKKRIFAVMLAVSALSATQAFAADFWDDGKTYLDPFNNDLYEVVSKVDDSKTPTESDDIDSIKGYEVNDGLHEGYEDGDFGEMFICLYDSNNNLVYRGSSVGSSERLDYNMGYASESCISGESRIVNVMTGEEYWFNNCYFDIFGNDGYGILYNGNITTSFMGNHDAYVIKLKKPALITVVYNGKKIQFDQFPIIEDGRTLVPLRAIFETLGAEVDWNGDTQTITAKKDNTEISLTINNTTASKNGESISLDVPAKIINDRTLVPVRFVADCFGVSVDWDGDMQRVILTSN